MQRKRKVSLIPQVKLGQEHKDMSTRRSAESSIRERQKKRRVAGARTCVFSMTAAMKMADRLGKESDSDDDDDDADEDNKAGRFMSNQNGS